MENFSQRFEIIYKVFENIKIVAIEIFKLALESGINYYFLKNIIIY